jgi:hypothetical protein
MEGVTHPGERVARHELASLVTELARRGRRQPIAPPPRPSSLVVFRGPHAEPLAGLRGRLPAAVSKPMRRIAFRPRPRPPPTKMRLVSRLGRSASLPLGRSSACFLPTGNCCLRVVLQGGRAEGNRSPPSPSLRGIGGDGEPPTSSSAVPRAKNSEGLSLSRSV